MIKLQIAAVLALSLPVAPAHAQTHPAAPSASAASGAHYQAAYALAQELRDQQSVLFEASHVFEAGTIAELSKNPQIAAAEQTYPGIVKYMFDAARPELERILVARLPELWRALADLIAAEMTDSEIAEAVAYYSSPAGRRFKAAMLRHYDYSQELKPLASDLDAEIGPDAIRRGIAAGVAGALKELSAEDKGALMRFSTSAAFRKISALNARILQAAADWGNREDPQTESRLEQIMGEAVERFLAEKGAAK